MRCVACKICEVECPPQCIYIVMDRDEKGKPRQRPKVFDIDISVCMQCQICVEVCPFDAIKMDNDYEKSQYGRFDELVEHLPDLLKSNEYYNRIKPTEATAVDAKLKAEKEKKAKKAAAPPQQSRQSSAKDRGSGSAPSRAPAAAVAPAREDSRFPKTRRSRRTTSVAQRISQRGQCWRTGAGRCAARQQRQRLQRQRLHAGCGSRRRQPCRSAAPAGNWPWHDPGMGMQQRLDLAKSAPLADKLMAAMAQTDCHACGYDCRGYADAIADGRGK